MIPLALALLGLGSLAAAVMLLRRIGPRYRVARLLAAAPEVTLGEAIEMSEDPRPTYVRVGGRVSSEEEFPDENDRPLVYRRARLQAMVGRDWQTVTDNREAVPFGLEARGAFIALDVDALAEGLVVIPRESVGRASELPADVAAQLAADVDALGSDAPADAPVRLLVEQVAAVEHALAAGVPTRLDDRSVMLRAGLGRPLILTTLELPAAMRVLAGDRRPIVLTATVLLAGGLALLAAALVAAVISG